MDGIPAYWLYGERDEGRFPDALHIETIVSRSRRHGWRIGAHRHPGLLQFFVLLGGGGLARIDGADHPLQRGSAVSIPPFAVHEFHFDAGTDGYVASVGGGTLRRLLRLDLAMIALQRFPLLLTFDPASSSFRSLKRQMELAYEEFAAEAFGRDAALAAHAELIALNFARSGALEPFASFEAHGVKTKLVKRFLECVEAGFWQHRSVKDYADELGISPTHLRRTCRAVLGYPALKVIHDRLLIEAKRKLIYSERPVSHIAYELGFEDAAYFARFFAGRAGASPSQYRARMSAAPRQQQ